MDTDGKNLKQLTNSDLDARGYPDISPDGKWVFYHKGGPEQGIWKVPVDGGHPVRLTADAARNPAVSPDGKWLAYYFFDGHGTSTTGIAVISCDGGPQLKRFPLPIHWGPIRWAPDSQALFVIQARNDVGNLWMQPLKGGAPRQFTHFDFERTNTFDFSRDGKQLVIWRSRVTKDVVLIHDAE
jgi:Tol biopolymer transport system component